MIVDASATAPNGSCEQVQRKAPKNGESRSEDAQESPKEEKVTD